MSKFEVSFTDSAVIFNNTRTGKLDAKETLQDALDDSHAVSALRGMLRANESGTLAALSVLCKMLDNPRMDAYKGTCPLAESVPNEAKSALRDVEGQILRPMMLAPLLAKGATQAKADAQVDTELKKMNAGSSYAVAKGIALKYFAYTGNLPKHNGKILTVPALRKLIENLDKPATEDAGIAGKLVALSLDVSKADGDKLGDFATAIAALKSMLGTYEACHREALETLTATIGNTDIAQSIDNQAKAITQNAIAKFEEATL